MVKDLAEVRSSQRKHMPDKAGSGIDVQTSLRGIAKAEHSRFWDLNSIGLKTAKVSCVPSVERRHPSSA
jgi:hypothetical protein